MKKGMAMLLAALGLLAAPGRTAAQEGAPAVFRFYGLEFGMNKEKVEEVVAQWPGTDPNTDPGYGMDKLFFTFDAAGRLMELRALYAKPEDPLRAEGLKRALGEKFVTPAKSGYPEVFILLDEFADRGAITLQVLSKTIREANIEGYKTEFISSFE